MGVSNSLRRLATFAERLEGSEPEITELRSRNEETGDGIEAQISVVLPLQADVDGSIDELSVTNATLTDDGAISIQLATALDPADEESAIDAPDSEVGDASRAGVESETETGRTTASGVTDGGTAIVSTPSSVQAAARERPAYKDPEELAAVYDAERTFPEMRDELGVDVTPKTVRHYMVEYGIHDPETLPSDDEGPKPAYKDPEELAAVYDAGRTFPEMRDELGVDVTPKTVRHYMVEHGIHDPETDSSGAPAEKSSDARETEQATDRSDRQTTDRPDQQETDRPGQQETDRPDQQETDRPDREETADDEPPPDSDDIAADIVEEVALPDDLSVVGVTEAVCTAKTLYEVQRELGIDREQTHRLLSELNLLELVHGRVSTVSAQSRTRETVERRIREAVTKATRTD